MAGRFPKHYIIRTPATYCFHNFLNLFSFFLFLYLSLSCSFIIFLILLFILPFHHLLLTSLTLTSSSSLLSFLSHITSFPIASFSYPLIIVISFLQSHSASSHFYSVSVSSYISIFLRSSSFPSFSYSSVHSEPREVSAGDIQRVPRSCSPEQWRLQSAFPCFYSLENVTPFSVTRLYSVTGRMVGEWKLAKKPDERRESFQSSSLSTINPTLMDRTSNPDRRWLSDWAAALLYCFCTLGWGILAGRRACLHSRRRSRTAACLNSSSRFNSSVEHNCVICNVDHSFGSSKLILIFTVHLCYIHLC